MCQVLVNFRPLVRSTVFYCPGKFQVAACFPLGVSGILHDKVLLLKQVSPVSQNTEIALSSAIFSTFSAFFRNCENVKLERVFHW